MCLGRDAVGWGGDAGAGRCGDAGWGLAAGGDTLWMRFAFTAEFFLELCSMCHDSLAKQHLLLLQFPSNYCRGLPVPAAQV